MAKSSVVTRADAFGGLLNGLAVVVGLGSVALGIFVATRTHGTQPTYPDGSQSVAGATQGLGYLGAVGIGVGGVVVAAILMWAGYVLRTLAVVASRPRKDPYRDVVTTSVVVEGPLHPIPPMKVPAFVNNSGGD